jgi:adenylate cyclase
MHRGRHLATVTAAGLAALWGLSLAFPHGRGELSILDRLEAPLADLRFLVQGQRPAPEGVTIVAIDDETVQEVGSYPLPRTAIAHLVRELAKQQPKVIALDLLFVAPGPAEGDRLLAEALQEAPSVLAAAGVFGSSLQSLPPVPTTGLEHVPVADQLFLPIAQLSAGAAVGVVNITTDRAGTPRHVPLLLRSGDRLLASFALRAASIAAGQDPAVHAQGIALGDRFISTDVGYALPLRFYGPRGAIQTVSASHVLRGGLPEAALRDQVAIVGATVTGGGDVFPTPFDSVLPGVEVLATAVSHLLSGDGLVRDRRTRTIDAVLAVSLPAILVLLLAWHRRAVGFAVISLVALLWLGITTAAFARGFWLSATLPLAAAAPPAILFGAVQLWLDRRRADALEAERGVLRRFQAPGLAERLSRDPNFLAEPVHQQAAVVFIDLSGFTGLSEALGPDETRDLLKGFHSLVDEEAVSHNGYVASFMADGAMILFGLPEPGPQDACHAVEVCVGLCSRMRAWLAGLPEPVSSRLGFKVGAHCGTIVASRLGGGSHQHITAIGDTVNVASRLMEVAAEHGAEVAVSDQLFRAAGPACSIFDSGALTGAFEATIRGRSGSIPVWIWQSPRPHADLQSGSLDSGRRHPG